MARRALEPSRYLEWGVASAPLPGETESGDLHLVRPTTTGLLVAVVDGVGHGPEAAEAARRAVETLEAYPSESVIGLVRRCHARLQDTRGVAMSLAKFQVSDDTVTWLAIGNVEAVLFRADPRSSRPEESPVMRSGVVGHQLPQLRASVTTVAGGDLLILATDGVEPEFKDALVPGLAPQTQAELILDRHRKLSDDALVLVARYRPEATR